MNIKKLINNIVRIGAEPKITKLDDERFGKLRFLVIVKN